MNQEKIKILEMIQSQTITPQEGAELLKALEDPKGNDLKIKKKEAFKMFKIRIKSSDGDKVNVQIPLEFAKVALRSQKGIPNLSKKMENMDVDIDFEQILDLIEQGTDGKIVDIESGDGDTVQIYIE